MGTKCIGSVTIFNPLCIPNGAKYCRYRGIITSLCNSRGRGVSRGVGLVGDEFGPTAFTPIGGITTTLYTTSMVGFVKGCSRPLSLGGEVNV